MLKIFLSSTSRDLASHREAVFRAVTKLGHLCRQMEDFGAVDATPLDLSLAEVRACDLFIFLLGPLHGSCPPGSERSFTELEYETAAQRKRLIFRTPDNFPVPMDLRESDAKFQRQKEFRARVGLERVVAEFSDPVELANLVVIAIRNGEVEPAPRGDETPDRGRLVPRMCDRTPQEELFRDHFSLAIRKRPGFPQIYFICGEERECPQYLVERLTSVHLGKYALRSMGGGKGSILSKDVEWKDEIEMPLRSRRLLVGLFEALHSNYELENETFLPADFARLEPLSSYPVVVVAHEIRTTRWHRADLRFLEEYLSFWDGVAQHRPTALCVVFLCIIYPPVEATADREAEAGLNGLDRKALERALLKIQRKREGPELCLCQPLPPLRCVEEEHVMRWFSHHKIYDMKARLELCREWFRSSSCRHMADIEYELEKIHRSIRG